MKFNRKMNELYSYKFETEYEKIVNTYIHTQNRHLISKNEQHLLRKYNIQRKICK